MERDFVLRGETMEDADYQTGLLLGNEAWSQLGEGREGKGKGK